MVDTDVDVVVIGAGMAGVTAARALAGGGAKVVVVESSDRVGGRVRTIRDFAETPVEAGAEFVHGSRAATWTDVRQAGLRAHPVPYRYSWFRIGKSTRWLPLQLLHPGVWRAFDILRSLHRHDGADMSAASFIESKGYRGRAGELARLTLTAHLPGGVDDVGVGGLVTDGVLHLEEGLNHRVLDGYDLLPRHITTGLEVLFGFRAASVVWGDDGVEVTATDGRMVSARTAVTTLPHGVLASGTVVFDPVLPAAKRAGIDRIATGPVAKVLLRFEERFWPRRMGQLVCGSGPVTLYWPTSFGTDGPPVLVAYATGPRAAALSQMGPDAAVEVVLDDLGRHFPSVRAERLVTGTRVVDWMSDPDAFGGYTYLPPGAVGARSQLAAADTGALVWAGSATVWNPVADTVEAAYLSGLRAAREVSVILTRRRPGRKARVMTPD